MCGFLGEFSFKDENLVSPTTEFRNLLNLSRHRGPDATELLQEKNYQLGFNRLSILDLSVNGNQPKESPSGRYKIVFNGEIYNFKELIETHDLKDLKSTSDTEVIVHLCDKLGPEQTVSSLNGMFAIAVVDTNKNKLILSRDFAGIKPHFYGVSDKGVVFASQFDQIYKHSWFKNTLELRPEIMKEYFGFGYMQAPNTIYKSLFQLNPGELITFDSDGNLQRKQLISFSKTPKKQTKETEDTPKHYNKLLDQILKRQLISDVPIASFLSGGIDSPLIAAHAKSNKSNIEAFTLQVADKEMNESDIAIEYANILSIKQKVIEAKTSDLLSQIDDYFDKCPEPFGDYSALPTYLISKHAVKDHKVMLSGDGGDELFYGYPRFKHVTDNKAWFNIPFKIRRPIISLFNKYKINSTPAPYYYKTISEWQIAKNLQVFPDILDKVVPKTSFSNELSKLYNLEGLNSKKALLEGLRYNEFYAHLQRVLVKVDRASMANSLEVRVPFLDKVSIDFAWQLESGLLKHKTLKKVLKECLAQFIPQSLINRKKMGFSIPIEDWLRNDLKDDVLHHVFEIPIYGEAHVDADYIKYAVSNFYDSKGPFSAWSVWHIYTWQKWAVRHANAPN